MLEKKKFRIKIITAHQNDNYFRLFNDIIEENFDIVEQEWDLIVAVDYHRYIKARELYPKCKILVITGETILGKRYYSLFPLLLPILGKRWLVRKICKMYFFKQLASRIKIYKSNSSDVLLGRLNDKNTYFILTNAIKKPNILNHPYFFQHSYYLINQLVKKKERPNEKKKFCAFICSHHTFDRKVFFEELSKYKRVDSYAGSSKNTDFPPKKKIDVEADYFAYDYHALNQEVFSDYKFVICFENIFGIADYITEKLPNAMLGNSIGIYRGASNIGEFFNTQSFINYDDYGSDEVVIEKIIELDNDDAKYQAMLNEPFFKDNVVPERLKNAKKDLMDFIGNIIEDISKKRRLQNI